MWHTFRSRTAFACRAAAVNQTPAPLVAVEACASTDFCTKLLPRTKRASRGSDDEELRLALLRLSRFLGGLASGALAAALVARRAPGPAAAEEGLGRPYRDVNAQRPRAFWEYEKQPLVASPGEAYAATRHIGEGRYSDVYEGISVDSGKPCAIKRPKPGKRRRLKREIKILQEVRGGPNIIKLLDVVQDQHGTGLVMELVDSETTPKRLYHNFTDEQARRYMFELLRAVDHCHSRGIMHRDVKPRNVGYCSRTQQLRLLDFGLADFYHPDQEYNVRVSSLYYKAPELLVGQKKYDYALDSWSLGCILASLVFRREPFFQGKNNSDQLLKIVRVLGTQDLFAYLAKHNLRLDSDLEELIGRHPKRSWESFVLPSNAERADPQALDLINRLLVYDHSLRLSPREALEHPYFDGVRAGRRRRQHE
eukprot:TRINITY_DN492_c0_g1_i7.p1 TRINITY_DN492_c0_g1~~TRINITY_DN492_c0_g1_i7.p1  ORF type:complete len:423 (-),score=66.66 TRINITY_DN492_c0_g1_i7:114-1382(-)